MRRSRGERLRRCCQSAKQCIRKSAQFHPCYSIPGVHSYRQQYFPRYGTGACSACWIPEVGHSSAWWAMLATLRRTFFDSIYCQPDHRADCFFLMSLGWFPWLWAQGDNTPKGLEIHRPSLSSGTRYINTMHFPQFGLICFKKKIPIGWRAALAPAERSTASCSQENLFIVIGFLSVTLDVNYTRSNVGEQQRCAWNMHMERRVPEAKNLARCLYQTHTWKFPHYKDVSQKPFSGRCFPTSFKTRRKHNIKNGSMFREKEYNMQKLTQGPP